ncbi:MAG: YdcF family protein [Actinobacteria bacterium]|nr:YdcF family protein [Actinomycetota bacterium]
MQNAAALQLPLRLARRPAHPGRRKRLVKRFVLAAIIAAITGTVAIAAINIYVALTASGQTVASVSAAPHAQAAIVPGALVHTDGKMSQMLADRVRVGAQLYLAGKVDRVIVSGDHGTWAYDEPGTMRRALQQMGVPAGAIFTDHAGFNTWATMKRARTIFGVKSAIVVTQQFHLTRALYLADSAGLEAHGFSADLHAYGNKGLQSTLREIPARVKAFGQAETGASVMPGPPIPIEGDGRRSWGPEGP